ncbi:MAG TPA: cbb3-type cytochrome c oxidase subunit II [Parachlamydiaceae bacterium]|nr:cbb3-type cytochrome c oxidase subunit II [Parachlamydiaceae bacterium]
MKYSIEKSALATFFGIVALFSTAILVVLIAPRHIDPTWTEPTSSYQVQMYEIADPNIYIGSPKGSKYDLQFVYHLKDQLSLLAFQESEFIKIIAEENLERYITRLNDPILKLSSRLLLLKKPENKMAAKAKEAKKEWLSDWERAHPDWKEEKLVKPNFQVYELYQPKKTSVFSLGSPDTILSEWVDKDFLILEEEGEKFSRAKDSGVIFVKNPVEYKVSFHNFFGNKTWQYDPNGEPITDVEELVSEKFGFRSRKELIEHGEHLYNIEGCWYCHTDQTRTLIQDTVLNGSESFPAPPSSANEYIYQNVTFPGTRRIGPDISRTGIKRPSRDWHRGHFWSPKTASKGSVMPSFHHFFDTDPRGTSPSTTGVPNYKFEAIYQYLMTKGTRITPPNQGWWLGKDPVNTKEIIEGLKR